MTTISVRTRREAIIDFYRDREYYLRMYKIALPIAAQQLFMSSLNMVGVVMIGQLGAAPVAAVGLANQVFFLLNIIIFGIVSGSAIFTAQLWGTRDIPNIRRVLGLALTLGLSVGVIFLLVAEFFPTQVLSIYSNDPQVIDLGSDYLRLIGFSFVLFAITYCYSSVLRSTGDVRTPLVVTIAALSLNTLLSFTLIFGRFGFPALGVNGAGIAVLISRVVECSALLFITYRKKSPAAGKLKEIFNYNLSFARTVFKPVLPVILNETLWSFGITTYNVIYAHISTDAVAAMNIVSSIDSMAFVLMIGMGNACAILVGHRIGEGDDENAFRYAGRTLTLGILGGLLIGTFILFSSDAILSLYKVDPVVIDYASRVLMILGSLLWLRATNMILFVGIFRSGGDTRFALLLDGLIIWVVGVPLTFIGAFILHLPIYYVYICVMSEEILKWILGMYRFISRKWIHNVAQTVTN